MKSKKNLIIIALVMIIGLFGISYAYFRYYMLGNNNHKIVSGDVSLVLNDGTNSINLTNVFPETIEEARREGRTDNILTFTISGINTTTNNDIYYEIMLNEGDSEEGKTRYKPEDLLFDLIEVGENNTETYLVEAMNFNDFNARRIWVDSVERNNSLTVNKTYKLRMWLREDVLISDTDPNADYKASVFKNSYGSIKVSVHGDFNKKTSPYNYMMARHSEFDVENFKIVSAWPTELEEMVPQFTEVRFMSMDKSLIDMLVEQGALDLTDTTKSPAGSVIAVPLPDSTGEGMALAIMSDGITMLPENSGGLFYNFQGVTQLHFNNINTNNVTNMTGMFAGLLSITSLNLSQFNTKNVTNMSWMFTSCENLVNLDLNSFDTGNVTNMDYMFNTCYNLNILDLTNFNTSNVTNMEWLFTGTKVNELNLSGWDTRNVTNMNGAFAVETKKINLSGWYFNNIVISEFNRMVNIESLILSDCDVSEVTNMSSMFKDLTMLTELNLAGWDTRNVTDMSVMFSGCIGLTTINLSDWDTSSVTNMGSMFYGCSNLTSLDLSGWNVSEVTDMGSMFSGCSSLTSLNLNGWNVSKVMAMSSMFSGCSSIKNINIDNWIIGSTAGISGMISSLDNYVTSLDLNSWDTSQVTSMTFMFRDCESLISLDISDWDTSNVTEMGYMFRGCSSLTSLDVGNWDTSSVSNISFMFYNCSGLTNLDLNDWNTSNVTDMSSMFRGCSSLTSLDVGNWDTSSVSNMSEMFQDCSSLTSLDVGNWDTSGVSDMSWMFRSCSGLTSLDINNFTFDSVTTYGAIFIGMKDRIDNTPTIIIKSETEQNWILALNSTNRPSSWTTENVIIK